jgi:hypothetical protein
MRGRIVIGALILIAAGATAYLLSQPEHGTVEWHKKEYLRARQELEGRTLRKQIHRHIQRLRVRVGFTPKREPAILRPVKLKGSELQKHELALIRLGFLEAKTVHVSKPLGAKVDSILDETRAFIPEKRRQFTHLSAAPTLSVPSFVRVVAPREDIGIWEDVIQRADAKAPYTMFLEQRSQTNASLLLTAPDKVPGLNEMLREKPDVRRDAR